MMQHPFFEQKQILLVDQFPKNKNDRTWCFWEKEPGIFESVVYRKWGQLDFYSSDYSSHFNIAPYEYKMIRGIDFYSHVLAEAGKHSNVHYCTAKVSAIGNEAGKAFAEIEHHKISAEYVFNSIVFNPEQYSSSALKSINKYLLLQHFKGWLIETEEDTFRTDTATFMDFRISQHLGTAFVYVLPVSPRKALVEYTLFTESLLSDEEYNIALTNYIKQYITANKYAILQKEFGIIPMTNFSFPKQDNNIINLGTAGGNTKASSGFTFQFIQKHSQEIVDLLTNEKTLNLTSSLSEKKFNLYDSTLLNVLANKKMGGDKIFASLFSKNPPQRILSFLDNESNFSEDLKILSSVPTAIFMTAALQEFWNSLKG